MMSVGAEGVISVASNLVPSDVAQLVKAASEGDFASAKTWHHKLFALCKDMLGLATNPIPIKAAMQMVARDTGELRLPMTPLEEDAEAKLRETLFTYGVVSAASV